MELNENHSVEPEKLNPSEALEQYKLDCISALQDIDFFRKILDKKRTTFKNIEGNNPESIDPEERLRDDPRFTYICADDIVLSKPEIGILMMDDTSFVRNIVDKVIEDYFKDPNEVEKKRLLVGTVNEAWNTITDESRTGRTESGCATLLNPGEVDDIQLLARYTIAKLRTGYEFLKYFTDESEALLKFQDEFAIHIYKFMRLYFQDEANVWVQCLSDRQQGKIAEEYKIVQASQATQKKISALADLTMLLLKMNVGLNEKQDDQISIKPLLEDMKTRGISSDNLLNKLLSLPTNKPEET